MRRLAPLWLLLLLAAPTALAHEGAGAGIEARATLPAWALYAAGALLVAVSFAVLGTRVERPSTHTADRPRGPPRAPSARVRATRLVGLAVLALLLAGPLLPGSVGAWTPELLWLGALGVLFAWAYLVGDPWPALSPARALAPLVAPRSPRALPDRLGSWPATAALLALVVAELAGGLFATATGVLLVAAAYLVWTLVGCARFGPEAWLPRADPLERATAWFGAIAPRGPRGRWRWPGARLGARAAEGMSDAAFLLALLVATNADGFLATAPGARLLAALGGGWTGTAAVVVGALLLFLGFLQLAGAAARRVTGSAERAGVLAAALAVALVPVAAGYHLAHLLVRVLDLVDPGLGPLALGGVAAGQAAVLLSGHVLGVLVTHDATWSAFPSRVQAVLAEVPLTALLVVYTGIGLWTLAEAAAGVGA